MKRLKSVVNRLLFMLLCVAVLYPVFGNSFLFVFVMFFLGLGFYEGWTSKTL